MEITLLEGNEIDEVKDVQVWKLRCVKTKGILLNSIEGSNLNCFLTKF